MNEYNNTKSIYSCSLQNERYNFFKCIITIIVLIFDSSRGILPKKILYWLSIIKKEKANIRWPQKNKIKSVIIHYRCGYNYFVPSCMHTPASTKEITAKSQ